MTDWMNDRFVVESGGMEYVPVKPPFALVAVTAAIGALSAVCFLFSNPAGYLAGTVASVLGGIAALVNLQRMGSANYVGFDWFVPLLRVVRYGVLGITLGHVAMWAYKVATGAPLW
jgi:hypothetical protein